MAALEPFLEWADCPPMKSHLFIALGLLIAAIFFMRGLEALSEPGLGLLELYIAGGFLISGFLVRAGWKERKAR